MDRPASPSPDLLDALTAAIRGVLGDDLVGLYLYGSAVSGGFDAGVSDLDLAAVTGPEVEALDLAGLERLHRPRLAGRFVRPCARRAPQRCVGRPLRNRRRRVRGPRVRGPGR